MTLAIEDGARWTSFACPAISAPTRCQSRQTQGPTSARHRANVGDVGPVSNRRWCDAARSSPGARQSVLLLVFVEVLPRLLFWQNCRRIVSRHGSLGPNKDRYYAKATDKSIRLACPYLGHCSCLIFPYLSLQSF